MTTYKIVLLCLSMLIALASCEQEETLQTLRSSSPDLSSTDLSLKSNSPSRNFEVLNLPDLSLEQDGYQRLKQNTATGSILYANIRGGALVGYLIRRRDGRNQTFRYPGHGGSCPDLQICIHPQTGKYIFYDNCVTDNPCDRSVCSELTWCIHPETGEYLLYDKCQTDDPCQTNHTPPIIIVAKKYNLQQFCPTVDYIWMIDPYTGEYLLKAECDYAQQLFLPAGW